MNESALVLTVFYYVKNHIPRDENQLQNRIQNHLKIKRIHLQMRIPIHLK